MKKTFLFSCALLATLFPLTACDGLRGADGGTVQRAHAQANTISVMAQPDGSLKAVPPKCPSYDDISADPMMNDPLPQLGCSTSGNLARMIVDPADLVRGDLEGDRIADRPLDGTVGAAAVQRYHEGKVYVPVSPSQSDGSGSDSNSQ